MLFADFSNRKIVFPFCMSFGTIIALSFHHQEQAVAERIAQWPETTDKDMDAP